MDLGIGVELSNKKISIIMRIYIAGQKFHCPF